MDRRVRCEEVKGNRCIFNRRIHKNMNAFWYVIETENVHSVIWDNEMYNISTGLVSGCAGCHW